MAAPIDPPENEATTETTAPQPGPWAADFAEYFGDNAEAIAAADRYMREKVQPRMTQLEEGTKDARELWKDLNDDTTGTLTEIVEEVYGADVAEKFKGLFGEQGENAPAEVVAEVAAAAEATPAAAVSDEDRELLEWAREKREAEARASADADYQQVKADLKAAHPEDLTDADLELIDPFIAGPGGGDPERGFLAYQEWAKQFLARHGVTPSEAAEAAEETPPPVLGGQAAPSAAPPVEVKYKSFDDAWDAWRAEEAVTPPPVVGSA